MSTGRTWFPNVWIIASFLMGPLSCYHLPHLHQPVIGTHWLLYNASDLCVFKLFPCLECFIYLKGLLSLNSTLSMKLFCITLQPTFNLCLNSHRPHCLHTHSAIKSYMTLLFFSWIMSPQYDCKLYKGRKHGLCPFYRLLIHTRKEA